MGSRMRSWQKSSSNRTTFSKGLPAPTSCYGDGAVTLLGDLMDGGADRLYGGGGRDYLVGDTISINDTAMAGNDLLYGGKGNDTLIGDALKTPHTVWNPAKSWDEYDFAFAWAGNDRIYGGAGNDVIAGDVRNLTSEDIITGDDRLYGGAGNDTIYGELIKTSFDDEVTYILWIEDEDGSDEELDEPLLKEASAVRVYRDGRMAIDVPREESSTPKPSPPVKQTLDVYYLMSWDSDIIEGGRGNDTLIGGPGYDRFVFKRGDGVDRIKDFFSLIDKVDLRAWGFDSFKDVPDHLQRQEGHRRHPAIGARPHRPRRLRRQGLRSAARGFADSYGPSLLEAPTPPA